MFAVFSQGFGDKDEDIINVILGDRLLRYSYKVLIRTGCPEDALETRDPNSFLPTNPSFCFSLL
jgi:hypothetical protein